MHIVHAVGQAAAIVPPSPMSIIIILLGIYPQKSSNWSCLVNMSTVYLTALKGPGQGPELPGWRGVVGKRPATSFRGLPLGAGPISVSASSEHLHLLASFLNPTHDNL